MYFLPSKFDLANFKTRESACYLQSAELLTSAALIALVADLIHFLFTFFCITKNFKSNKG